MPFGYYFGWTPPDPDPPIVQLNVADTQYPFYSARGKKDVSPGRRVRAFCHMPSSLRPTGVNLPDTPQTWGEVLSAIDTNPDLSKYREDMSSLQLRTGIQTVYTEIPENYAMGTKDAVLHQGLQDLGWQIVHDISKACDVFNNPDLYYPGVEDGIEPVPEDHVKLVIWALQRELNRELRYSHPNIPVLSNQLPAVPLAELPWRIQRALVERRRLRYAQWGITHQNWLDNSWSLWNVPMDEDWVPQWAA